MSSSSVPISLRCKTVDETQEDIRKWKIEWMQSREIEYLEIKSRGATVSRATWLRQTENDWDLLLYAEDARRWGTKT